MSGPCIGVLVHRLFRGRFGASVKDGIMQGHVDSPTVVPAHTADGSRADRGVLRTCCAGRTPSAKVISAGKSRQAAPIGRGPKTPSPIGRGGCPACAARGAP